MLWSSAVPKIGAASLWQLGIPCDHTDDMRCGVLDAEHTDVHRPSFVFVTLFALVSLLSTTPTVTLLVSTDLGSQVDCFGQL